MANENLTIALISPGAMGSAVASRLTAAGFTVLTSLEGRSNRTRDRARAAGMQPVGDADLAAADIVLSVVPPADALPLVERLLPHIAARPDKPLYVDANALSPGSKRHLAERLQSSDCTMVDGSIIGPPPLDDGRRTSLFLAGPRAAEVAILDGPGLAVTVLDGPVGAAAALKMCFGGINKGIIGLAAAMLLAAERHGAAEALRAELGARLPDLMARFEKSMPDMFPKAYRWVAEMREIAQFLVDDPDAAKLFEGLAGTYEHLATDMEGVQSEIGVLKRAVEPR
ncbi:NAD(P)-dependent oxidoreductase [Consotaella aegiceratis]|uniref:NAD(P)-dependent oxidoreductase n=1 Tax=Consotaella aegiceratis TaxID=3097961 RepID=UPI002F40CC88